MKRGVLLVVVAVLGFAWHSSAESEQALLTSMLAYAGTYTIDAQAKTVVHHIDIS
jgi:hypothetical protein